MFYDYGLDAMDISTTVCWGSAEAEALRLNYSKQEERIEYSPGVAMEEHQCHPHDGASMIEALQRWRTGIVICKYCV